MTVPYSESEIIAATLTAKLPGSLSVMNAFISIENKMALSREVGVFQTYGRRNT